MDFHVAIDGRGDRAARIYRELRAAVLDGRLRPGERLPPSRELAADLGVARSTVTTVYDRLIAEGYLVARRGAGTFAAAVGGRTRRTGERPAGAARPTAWWDGLDDPLWREPHPVAYDFGIGSPDPALFPADEWRRSLAAALRDRRSRSAHYGDPAGDERLRAAVARRLGVSRSVEAEAHDVLITNGAQQAFDLLARVLLRPGDVVAVEDPGYPPVRQLFASLGARVVPVPVDEHGLRVDLLPAARLVYVTPSHQFPLGGVLPLERRTALLAWAERHDAVVIEDDYDSEFRFAARPLDPLHRLDNGGRVVYVGTFSKTMLPSLRVGFIVAPPSLLSALRSAKRLTDWHTESLTQSALARFVDTGGFARHLRLATRAYAARHASIAQQAAERLGEWLHVVPSVAGLHLALLPREGVALDSERIAARAAVAGVVVQPLPRFCIGERREGLLLGFGAVPAADVPDGLRLLAEAARRVVT